MALRPRRCFNCDGTTVTKCRIASHSACEYLRAHFAVADTRDECPACWVPLRRVGWVACCCWEQPFRAQVPAQRPRLCEHAPPVPLLAQAA